MPSNSINKWRRQQDHVFLEGRGCESHHSPIIICYDFPRIELEIYALPGIPGNGTAWMLTRPPVYATDLLCIPPFQGGNML